MFKTRLRALFGAVGGFVTYDLAPNLPVLINVGNLLVLSMYKQIG